MATRTVIVALAAMCLLSSCSGVARNSVLPPVGNPSPSPTAAAQNRSAAAPGAAWQIYTNADAGFSISYPSTWQLMTMPDENAGRLHAALVKGPEGGVELHWGIGLGGACPQGYQPVRVAEGELPACHIRKADGTEQWSLAGKSLGSVSFSAVAYTSDTTEASRDLVLQTLSTLRFP